MADKKISELTPLTTGNIANTDELEIQESDQSYSKRVTVEVLNEIEAAARAAADNAIIAGIGANADGSYATPAGTNYLDSTTDVMDALTALDDAIGDNALILSTYIILSVANMHSMYATPIEVIAAPGATNYIEIISASAVLDYDSDAFAMPAGGKLVLQFDGGASHLVEWSETFVESTSDTYNMGVFTSNVELLANTKIEVTTTEQVTIDASDDGTIRINVLYAIRNVSTAGAGGS